MKTIEKQSLTSVFKLAFLAVLFLAFSCSPDTLLPEENLETANAKSKNEVKSVLKTLVKGAALSGANGIDIGPDGHLYVASVNGQEIVVMNKNNGKIIKRFGPEMQVLGPDDLVIGPDGTLYWTDILTGFVGRMTLDGQLLGYQEVAPGVNPIRFSEDGRLFVGLDFLGDGLYELDPNLVDPPRLIISCPTGFCLGFFNSFDTREEDGRLYLYGPLFAANLVIAIDVTEETPTKFPTFPDVLSDPSIRIVAGLDGAFENPAATKFGPDGLLYVLDQAGEVWKVNPDGLDDKTLFTTLEPGLDNMVFDSDGTLYMTNNDEGWVAEILPSGQARIISPGGMIAPQGLAVIAGSNNQDVLFEADLFRLRQFNGTSGQQINNYKGFLIPEEEPKVGLASLILPMNLSVDGNNLVVSSWFSSAVQVWNPELGVIENYPDFPVPIDAVRVNGDIVVSDFALGGVVYASNAAMIAPLVASGLATDGETLWAADWATGEIWQIDFVSEPPTKTVVATGLMNPEGLALDNEGRLLVVENSAAVDPMGVSRLSRIDLSTGARTTIVEGLELGGPGLGAPPTWSFDGVAIGPSGDIYVSGGGANVIYRIRQNKVN
jgi:sugar lactone lactonase YvrE